MIIITLLPRVVFAELTGDAVNRMEWVSIMQPSKSPWW